MRENKWNFEDDNNGMENIQEIVNVAIGLVITIGLFFSLMILSAAFI